MKTLPNSKARTRQRLTLAATYAATAVTLAVADENLKVNGTHILDFNVFVENATLSGTDISFGALYVGIMSTECYAKLTAASETDVDMWLDESIWVKTPDIDRTIQLNTANAVINYVSNINGVDVDVQTPFTDIEAVIAGNTFVIWGKGRAGFADVNLIISIEYERVLLTDSEFINHFASIGC